ncbi:hypothetical protein, partial [Bacillus sp. V3B]|uniref:hypothetical protein n=1 Tax=Bacillus sp. V3B TaxID=2804915 RepID=UPI00210BCBAC
LAQAFLYAKYTAIQWLLCLFSVYKGNQTYYVEVFFNYFCIVQLSNRAMIGEPLRHFVYIRGGGALWTILFL